MAFYKKNFYSLVSKSARNEIMKMKYIKMNFYTRQKITIFL